MVHADTVAFYMRRTLSFVTWFVIIVAAVSHFIHPMFYTVYFLLYVAWTTSLLFESVTFFFLGKRMVAKYESIDWEKKCRECSSDQKLIIDRLIHLIIVPNYKEELETLTDTLEILAEHTWAKSKYVICLAMEEAEVGNKEKSDILLSKYEDSFFKVLVTVHPKDLPGETRGKAPNVSWAVETCKKTLQSEYNLEDILVTVQDADTHFINDYFACITYKYATLPNRTKLVYAPPISFYSNALKVPAPVRVTDMVWCTTVLNQLSTGRQVKFPCSCYSLSMDLCHTVGYWDKTPEAIGEDAHMFLKCLFKTDGAARTETIYVPAGCYNVCDDTYIGSIKARYHQMYRHLWGTFDLAYAFQQGFLRKKMKFSPKFWAIYEMFKVRIIPSTATIVIGVVPFFIRKFPVYQTYPYVDIYYWLGWVQTTFLIAYVFMAVTYELLHRGIVNQAIKRGTAIPQNKRNVFHFILDWILFPIVSLGFFLICSLHVHFMQHFTDSINYVVAKKPTVLLEAKPILSEVLTVEN